MICSAVLPPASQAIALRLRHRSPRSRLHPRPASRHWPDCGGTLHGARPLGKSCPIDCRTESSVQTWLSPVVNSAASQLLIAKLIDSRQSPRLLPLYSPLLRQGLFPRPALPGFIGTASPSAICRGRRCPSRARRCCRPAVRRAPLQTSLVAHKSSCVRALTTTPAERSGAYLARLPDHGGLPGHCGRSASAAIFSGPAQCSLSLRPARCASLLTEGFS